MRIAALDIGDKWTGIALSDELGILAKPYKTIETSALLPTLMTISKNEGITTIIVGLPKTLKGTDSEQTIKVRTHFETLQHEFPSIIWKLWDERFSSQQAAKVQQGRKTEKDKHDSHAIAAAFILTSYLLLFSYEKEGE